MAGWLRAGPPNRGPSPRPRRARRWPERTGCRGGAPITNKRSRAGDVPSSQPFRAIAIRSVVSSANAPATK
jgi:hypothetical protein